MSAPTPSSETCPVCGRSVDACFDDHDCHARGYSRTQAALTAAQAEVAAYRDLERHLLDVLRPYADKVPGNVEVRAAVDALRAEVERLTRERDEALALNALSRCSYCGEVGDSDPVRVSEHILACEERPEGKLVEALDVAAFEHDALAARVKVLEEAGRRILPLLAIPHASVWQHASATQEHAHGTVALRAALLPAPTPQDHVLIDESLTPEQIQQDSARDVIAAFSDPAPAPTGSAPTPRLSVTALPWLAIRDTYEDREHRQRAVACWVDKRADGDLWIVAAPDGSSCLVGGERSARLIADAVNAYRAPTGSEGAAGRCACGEVPWIYAVRAGVKHHTPAMCFPVTNPAIPNIVAVVRAFDGEVACERCRGALPCTCGPSRGEGTPEAAKGLCGTFKCPRCGSATPHAHPDETAHQALIREEEVARRCDHPPEHWRGTELIVECLLCNGTGIKAPKEQP